MPVYKVPIDGTPKIIAATNQTQAIKAAFKPLLGKVETLSPNQIAEAMAGGGELLHADKILNAKDPAPDAPPLNPANPAGDDEQLKV